MKAATESEQETDPRVQWDGSNAHRPWEQLYMSNLGQTAMKPTITVYADVTRGNPSQEGLENDVNIRVLVMY